jgi:tetratricopeptide (TPR) repeat protein
MSHSPPPPPPPTIDPPTSGRDSLARLVIVTLVVAALWPLVRSEFGGMDDDINVSRNPHFNPPTLAGLRYVWTTPQYDLYVPVTYTAWWLVAQVAYHAEPDASGLQLNPYLFHLLNLILHALAALAAFEVIRRCVRETWPAAVGALVFALHPVQVESVGWIAGTKDVLAGMLALVALWRYLRTHELSTSVAKRRLAWVLGGVAFILAMLAKPGVVILPLIAFALDWLVLRVPVARAVVRAVPWLVLAIPCVIWTKWLQPAAFIDVPLWQRPFIATDALAFYLYKLVWPFKLGIHYGRTPQEAIARGWVWWTWIVPAAVAIAAVLARRAAPVLTAALAIFVIALLPVLGIVPFDFQLYSTVADHYLYLPMLGAALAGAWLASRRPRGVMIPIAWCIVMALGVLAHLQARHWRDAEAIFSRAQDVNPQSWLAHNQLANIYSGRGDYARAVEQAKVAAELNPHVGAVRITLGFNLAKLGRFDEAIDAYRAATDINPKDVVAHTNLANLYADRKQFDDAIRHYQAALAADSNSAIAHANLASVYEERARLDDARRHYRRALEIDPNYTDARRGLERLR